MKSKYSDKIYEITKVKNNSVYIKDDDDNLYQVMNEIKTVIKPDNPVKLTAKKQATVDSKQTKTLKNEDVKQDDLRQSKREINPKNNPNDGYQRKYQAKAR
jgi:hypothetical protein